MVVVAAPAVEPALQPPPLTDSERRALLEFWSVYDARFDDVASAIDQHAEQHPEIAGFIGAAGTAERLQTRALIHAAIVENDWLPYLMVVEAAGTRYAEEGLSFGAWFAAGRTLRLQITPLVVDALRADPDRLAEAVRGSAIFIDLAMMSIGGAYLAAKERTIDAQREAILELSTPVLELRPGLLLLPLVGVIDTHRAAALTDSLLEAIAVRRSTLVIMDVTGVPAVDTAIAAHLTQAAQAARLMGAETILVGLSAANALVLANLGIGLDMLRVAGTLSDAVAEAQLLA
jgi:anti-anti-sigma regulatory factor